MGVLDTAKDFVSDAKDIDVKEAIGMDDDDWNDMKNIAMTGVGIYGVSKLDQAAAVAHKVYKRFGKINLKKYIFNFIAKNRIKIK